VSRSSKEEGGDYGGSLFLWDDRCGQASIIDGDTLEIHGTLVAFGI